MADHIQASALILGSASPRRADLLTALGIDFTVMSVDIDESSLVQTDPVSSVRAIASAKFAAASQLLDGELLLTADTLVSCDRAVMGKPATDADLTTMLQAMSARPITVITATCLGAAGSTPRAETVTTTVTLRELSAADIADYVATGIGMDKAAGLALQAEAGDFIESVDGCWSNVLGLPVCVVVAALGDRSRQCSVELCGSHRG